MTGPRPVAFPLGKAGACWSRKQGSNLRLTGRMKPPLYQLSYSAFDEIWLPLLDSNQAARDQSPVPYQLGEGAIPWCHVRDLNPI